MAGNIPRIKEFPTDDRYWRIDAFGAIVRNHNIPSEPFIQLVITPFISNKLHLLDPKELISTGATNDGGKNDIKRCRPIPLCLQIFYLIKGKNYTQ